ncbi:MAG: hypothetical protein RLZ35_1067 [Pseudomonadota bacterium]|jgi:intracellular multiplication protein IcmS
MSIETDLQDQLVIVANSMGCRFFLKGEPIETAKVFSPHGLLPSIIKRADQLCSFCLGFGLGVTFERAESAMLGVTLTLDNQVSTVLRLLCATDILAELVQSSPSIRAISVDNLAAD